VNIKKTAQGILSFVLSALKYATLFAGAFAAVAPIGLVIITSLKTSDEVYTLGTMSLPQHILNPDNYITAFSQGGMIRGFINTTILVVIAVTGSVINGSMAAYVLHRFDFKGKSLIKRAFLFASVVPGMTLQVMLFRTINTLHLFNTRGAASLLYIGTDVIAIYIFLRFLETISVALDEAAMMEGASYFYIYRRIMLPLLSPAVATVMIIKSVGIYNDFYTPYLYMPRPDLRVISTALFQFRGQYGTQWEVICAGIMITILPVLVVFIIMQKYIYNGLTAGSIK
jgi:multiple sugar transport system permease protein